MLEYHRGSSDASAGLVARRFRWESARKSIFSETSKCLYVFDSERDKI